MRAVRKKAKHLCLPRERSFSSVDVESFEEVVLSKDLSYEM